MSTKSKGIQVIAELNHLDFIDTLSERQLNELKMGFLNGLDRIKTAQKKFAEQESQLKRIKWMTELTAKELSNYLVHGYVRLNDKYKVMIFVIICMIQKYYFIKRWNIMTWAQAASLRVYDKIDHRDFVGKFGIATITEKQGSNLRIHYDGYSRKWDVWSDYEKELYRFAKAGSISDRVSDKFGHKRKGDYIDINPSLKHPGWKRGRIRIFDVHKFKGQVQIVYDNAMKTQHQLYWTHLDNPYEIAEFGSKYTPHSKLTSCERKEKERHDVISKFVEMTNSDRNTAKAILKIENWRLRVAVSKFFESI